MKILLASRSPQRSAILTQLGVPFRVLPSEHDEETVPGDPVATVEQNARGKALHVAARVTPSRTRSSSASTPSSCSTTRSSARRPTRRRRGTTCCASPAARTRS